MKKFFNCKNILKKSFSIQNLCFFLVAFFILVFRAPKDFLTPYLWAEDGSVLIEGSIYNGLKGVFIPNGGTYFVIQKSLALLCYWLVIPSGSIAALPYIMQIIFKSVSVFGVLYFINDRFSWIVQRKIHRFFICLGIILLMPQHSFDVITVDTSLPFELFFLIYLIGLDSLCSEKKDRLSFGQTVCFILLGLSFAGAVFITAIAFAIFIQWLYGQKKARKLDRGVLFVEIIKLIILFVVAFLQIKMALGVGRVSENLDLLNRLILNTKSFMFFPYWHQFHSWLTFGIGFVLFAILIYTSGINWKVVAYSCIFSFCFMLYCSMVSSADIFYVGEMTGRYVFTCFEIASLLLGCCLSYLAVNTDKLKRCIAGIIIVIFGFLSVKTYNIPVQGEMYAELYKENIDLFKKNGQEALSIPIGPWPPLTLTVPTSFNQYSFNNDLEFTVEKIDGIYVQDKDFGNWTGVSMWGSVDFSGYVRTGKDNQLLKRLFIKKDSTYIAANEITIINCPQNQQVQCNGFKFNLAQPNDFFSEGFTEFELIGETEDGEWHYGRLYILTKHIQ